jgi:hypothetical protein
MGTATRRAEMADNSIVCITSYLDLPEVALGSWTGLIWLMIGQVAGTSKCSNELSGFIKFGKFLD